MPNHPLLNQPAPSFSLPDVNGNTYTFTPDALDRPAVVLFIPQIGSYGCSKEMCGFRDRFVDGSAFNAANVQLVAIGPSTVEHNKKYVADNNINYTVLSDEHGEARKAFHCAKGLMGLSEGRLSFVIDQKGVVRDVMDSVLNYNGHVKFALQTLERLNAESANGGMSPTPTATAAAPMVSATAA